MSNRDRGVLDTSVIIDITEIDVDMLPGAGSIAALTLAELTSGPLSTNDQGERAERSERLQWAESMFEAIPFDVAAARAFGRVYAASLAAKQKPRGARAVDLLIAATALSRGLPLYTRNPTDFRVVAKLLEIVGRASSDCMPGHVGRIRPSYADSNRSAGDRAPIERAAATR